MGVTGAPFDTSPAQKGQQGVKQGAAYPLPKDKDRAQTGKKAGPEKKNRQGVL